MADYDHNPDAREPSCPFPVGVGDWADKPDAGVAGGEDGYVES